MVDVSLDECLLQRLSTPHGTFFYGFSGVDVGAALGDSRINDCLAHFRDLRLQRYKNPQTGSLVTHHRLREPGAQANLIDKIRQWDRDFSAFTTVCHIGMGGSVTGMLFLSRALSAWNHPQNRRFIAITSHDEWHIQRQLQGIDITKTLFIVASKSGSTVEVAAVLTTIIAHQHKTRAAFLGSQVIGITGDQSAYDCGLFAAHHTFDNGIGGRFSITSAVSLVSLGLVWGDDHIRPFLQGAHEADMEADQSPNSVALIQAVIRYHQMNQYAGLAIVPYGEVLADSGLLLSQLICESLGKPTADDTKDGVQHAPIVVSGVGPGAQHTFFQQLHQGTPAIPVEFMMFSPKTPNQAHLLRQMVGQSVALFEGGVENGAYFPGRRPSTIWMMHSHSMVGLGYWVASLENRIACEGFLQEVNAFDQPGVELGKRITQQTYESGSTGDLLVRALLKQ
jgi:glucose-6-phosphate isomerase